MPRSAICVEGLSKRYQVGTRRRSSETLLGQLAARLRELRGDGPAEDAQAQFWALRDVNFELKEGEVLGIIGHNGSGKSTLLKILARITEPTAGRALVRGRMASLLEVGTGFHPDLSGRDNVHMNAAILGMSRHDIARRFDEIVEFSGVERFIDTPIKRYSSGMKVRLAFSVAAHLDPDVLLVDEVLAVGDAAFQKKCLNRIEQVSAEGRTVLFVSHHLTTVARLCKRAIVLSGGTLGYDGHALDAIRVYTEALSGVRTARHWSAEGKSPPGDGVARLLSVELLDGDKPAHGPINVHHRIGVRIRYEILKDQHAIMPSVHVFDAGSDWVFAAVDADAASYDRPRARGCYETTAHIPENLMNEGFFSIAIGLATPEPHQSHCWVTDCVGFTIFDPMVGDSARGGFAGDFPGPVRPILQWQTRSI